MSMKTKHEFGNLNEKYRDITQAIIKLNGDCVHLENIGSKFDCENCPGFCNHADCTKNTDSEILSLAESYIKQLDAKKEK